MPYKDLDVRRKKHRDIYERNRNRLRLLMAEVGCHDCGTSGDWRILEFDHLPGMGQRRTVGTLLKGRWTTLMGEIAKCDLVCANWHSIRTHERRQLEGRAVRTALSLEN